MKFFEERSSIENNRHKQIENARLSARHTFSEAHKVATSGAILSGAIGLGICLYEKNKQGKKPWEFDIDDWTEFGFDFGKSMVKGYVSGHSIYYLTNVCNMSSPAASALITATMGIVKASNMYRRGDIDSDEFIELTITSTVDAGAAAIGATIGQSLIPIPILGAVVGTIVTSTALSIGKNIFSEKEKKLINIYTAEIDSYVKQLDIKYKKLFEELTIKFKEIESYQQLAFDLTKNIELNFMASVHLAGLVEVDDKLILKDMNDIDNYFM